MSLREAKTESLADRLYGQERAERLEEIAKETSKKVKSKVEKVVKNLKGKKK
jgi:hypothetical protein